MGRHQTFNLATGNRRLGSIPSTSTNKQLRHAARCSTIHVVALNLDAFSFKSITQMRMLDWRRGTRGSHLQIVSTGASHSGDCNGLQSRRRKSTWVRVPQHLPSLVEKTSDSD